MFLAVMAGGPALGVWRSGWPLAVLIIPWSVTALVGLGPSLFAHLWRFTDGQRLGPTTPPAPPLDTTATDNASAA